MQEIHEFLKLIDGVIGGAQWFAYLLLFTGVFFTIYLKFPQIRYFRHALKVVKGKFDKSSDEGDTSHFQALATALSGTVGTEVFQGQVCSATADIDDTSGTQPQLGNRSSDQVEGTD